MKRSVLAPWIVSVALTASARGASGAEEPYEDGSPADPPPAVDVDASDAASSDSEPGARDAPHDETAEPAAPDSEPPPDTPPVPQPAPPSRAGASPPDAESAAAPAAGKAAQQGTDESEPEEVEAERRSGFMVGISLAGALGGASGYPNDANKIDRDEYYTNTGVSLGAGGTVWLGGALTDWISVGLGFSYAALFPSEQRLTGGAIELHVETFPGWSLGGVWRELGVYLLTGAGLATVELAEGSDPLVDTGGASKIGFGLFYEGIRAWQISMGPFVGGDFLWSPTALRPAALLGWRTALYTGP